MSIVYGVLVGPELFITLFSKELRAVRDKYPKLQQWDPIEFQRIWDQVETIPKNHKILVFIKQLCETIDLCNPDWAIELYWEFIHDTNYIFPFNSTEWVYGIQVDTVTFENLCIDDLPKVTTDVWEEFATQHDLQGIPRSYLLVD